MPISNSKSHTPLTLLMAVMSFLFSVNGHAQEVTLSFAKAVQLAATGPRISAMKSQLDADRQAQNAAGRYPDPKFFLGLDNVSIEGDEKFSLTRDFMTMQRIGVMQELPNPAKRTAEMARAQAVSTTDQMQAAAIELDVKRETAIAWLECYFLDKRLALFDSLYHENELLKTALEARLSATDANASDSLVAEQDRAMLDESKDETLAESQAAHARLARWIGPFDDAPLVDPPAEFKLNTVALQNSLHSHPEIQLFEAQSRQLNAELDIAKAQKKPNWAIQAAYQRRPDFSDMASVELSVTLPIFNDERKEPLVRAKQKELARLQSERDDRVRAHQMTLTQDLAEYARWQKAYRRINQIILPLARQKEGLKTAQYQSGNLSLTEVISARREVVEARLKMNDVEKNYFVAGARIYFGYPVLQQE